jgi:anti-sigma factor (TIGR02949 family)
MAESADHISCQEVVELVTDYLDEALPAEAAALFEQHINFCEGCVWYLDQIRRIASLTGRLREEDVPAQTREQLVTAFREWRRS